MTWSSSLAALAVLLRLLVTVTARRLSVNNDSHAHSDQLVMPDELFEGCYVVTIFGLKTADCGKQRARSVPSNLDSDLQVLQFASFNCSSLSLAYLWSAAVPPLLGIFPEIFGF